MQTFKEMVLNGIRAVLPLILIIGLAGQAQTKQPSMYHACMEYDWHRTEGTYMMS